MSIFRKFCFLQIYVTCIIGGCAESNMDIYKGLQSEDPDRRIEAVKLAAKTDDKKALPFLVDRLTDSEADVRFFAIMALRKITGQNMGYCHYEDACKRAEAVRRWRRWLEKTSGPRTRPAKEKQQNE